MNNTRFTLLAAVTLICLFSLSDCQTLQLSKQFKSILNNSTMNLAGQLSISTNNIVYYDSIAPNQRNQSLYLFDLASMNKTRINQSYYSSAFSDVKGGQKQRYVIIAEQIPDWTFRTLRFVAFNRYDMSYITYAYTTLQMEAIIGMGTHFDKNQTTNQTIKSQFRIGVITDKAHICTWAFNIETKTATQKSCTPAHAYNATAIVSYAANNSFITGGADSVIRVWQNNKSAFSWIQTKPISALLISGNNVLWNGDAVGTIRAYNLTTRNPYTTTNLTQHKAKIISLTSSEKGEYLVSCDADGYVILWSTLNGGKMLQKVHFAKQNRTIQAGFFVVNGKSEELVINAKKSLQSYQIN